MFDLTSQPVLSPDLAADLNFSVRNILSARLTGLVTRLVDNAATMKTLEAAKFALAATDMTPEAIDIRLKHTEMEDSYVFWRSEIDKLLSIELLLVGSIYELAKPVDAPRMLLQYLNALEAAKQAQQKQDSPAPVEKPVAFDSNEVRWLADAIPDPASNGVGLRLWRATDAHVEFSSACPFLIRPYNGSRSGFIPITRMENVSAEYSITRSADCSGIWFRLNLCGKYTDVCHFTYLEIVYSKHKRIVPLTHSSSPLLFELSSDEIRELMGESEARKFFVGEDLFPAPSSHWADLSAGLSEADAKELKKWRELGATDPRFIGSNRGVDWSDMAKLTPLQRAMLCENINRTFNGNLSAADKNQVINVLSLMSLQRYTGPWGDIASIRPAQPT